MHRLFFKGVILATIAALVFAFFYFDVSDYLTLQYVKEQYRAFQRYYAEHQVTTIAVYLGVYVATTAASLPGATVLTLAGGALFGLLLGTLIVSLASTIGATLAFLAGRFVFRDAVQRRLADKLKKINEGVERDGALYLFTLRLIPVFPFFVINLAMALTPIRVATFFVVSQIGMLPATVVYVNAGTELGELESASGILSPSLLGAFLLLALFPFFAKRFVDVVKVRWALRKYPRPRHFDYDVVVIGAGSAGLVSAYIATTVRAKAALVERQKMGGDCLNTGCVPSKALIRSAHLLADARRSQSFGIANMSAEFAFREVMERVQRIIRTVEPHDSPERYRALGVDVYDAQALIRSPFEVEITGADQHRTLTTRSIIVASGAEPFVPPIDGLADVGYVTSDTVWELRELPPRLVVLGGGPIGCELTQAFRRFGAEVTQVEQGPRLLSREDADVAEHLQKRFEEEGVRVLTGHRAVRALQENGQKLLECQGAGGTVRVEFDQILAAVGRKPRTSGFGLEELGVRVEKQGTLATDDFLRTNVPNIYVCGDVAGPYQFTHTASHQAWYATVNALFAPLKSFRVDYSAIPWCTFTDPEIARVGLNKMEAKQRDIEHEVTRYDIRDLDRAIAEEEAHGFIEVLTPPGKDRILGVTIVSTRAGELLSEYVLAMKHGIGLKKILGTIHTYPTLAEANRAAAGEWRKAHKPELALKLLGRYFEWRRG